MKTFEFHGMLVPEIWFNNFPALFQIMARHRQATSHYLDQWLLVYWCIYASLGLNDFYVQLIPCWNCPQANATTPFDNKSTLVQVIALCHCWPRYISPTGPQWVNSLGFYDDIGTRAKWPAYCRRNFPMPFLNEWMNWESTKTFKT